MRKILLLLYLVGLWMPADAARPLLMEADHRSLAGHLEVLIDQRHEHTTETGAKANFQAIDGQLNVGFTRAAVWLRFSLQRPASADTRWWLEVAPTLLSHVTLDVPRPGGGFEVRDTGNAMGPETRELADSSTVFALPIDSTQAQTYYIRIETANDLPHIFEKFFRCCTARAQPGTGLGLALARQVIESHNGILQVVSTQGVGTTATIRLPGKS